MDFDWQNAAALMLVAAATGCLSWQAWRVLSARRQGGCGSCSNCPSTAADGAVPNLVPLVAIRLDNPRRAATGDTPLDVSNSYE